jgi:phosphoenolpyruvate carboxylase
MLTRPLRASKASDESGLGPAPAPDAPPETGDLLKELRALLAEYREGAKTDPFGNPILRMALELTRLTDRGELSPAALEELVRHMTLQAFERRAERLRAYVGEAGIAANERRLRELFGRIARSGRHGQLLPFHSFQALMERFHYGIVFTAHPTFSMPHQTGRLLARLASGTNDGAEPMPQSDVEDLLAAARVVSHRPPGVTLNDELACAMDAIGHGVAAIGRLHSIVLDVARELYPREWKTLVPRLVSLASWVGYDHDGRSDIGWADTLHIRLKSKHAQLVRQSGLCADVLAQFPGSKAASTLELIESILALATKQVEQQIDASDSADRSASQKSRLFARQLVQGRDHALTDVNRIVKLIARAIEQAEEPALAIKLGSMRAALQGMGLGLTHTHFRLNSTQLHNAIRHQIGLETSPNDPQRRHSYLNRVNELLEQSEAVTVNLGSLIQEKSSAKRMFMMLAQLTKYIDAETPIRFLIAETENALTLLVALHFAKLFKVDRLIEISPLFETEEALLRGDAVIEEALRSRHYRDYVKRMGRLCIQFGYSDSGRYIGQSAASFLIERLRLKLAAVLARHGLSEVQVVLFNTHGESMGRGGHPASLIDRLRYLAPDASRAAFTANEIAVKEESSFQGEDGYLYFLTPELAFASVCRVVESSIAPPVEATADPIYAGSTLAGEFFAVVREEFSNLVADPDYAVLLGAFGRSLTDNAGSRPVVRQHEYRSGINEITHPSQIRAIANNTILQQMGFLANTIDGVGRAASHDAERFRFLLAKSPRFQQIMSMVAPALVLSDPDVLGAYLQSFDPGMWLNRSGRTRNTVRRDELRLIARHTETANVHARLAKVLRRLQGDYLLLRQAFAEAGGGESAGASPGIEDRNEVALLHALRISIIHRLYLLASHIPDFTPHDGFTRDDLVQRILRLDVDNAVAMLKDIFPKSEKTNGAPHDWAEPASYAPDAAQTYEQEHATIFDPLAVYFRLVKEIGAAITHRIGAIG